jgi:hypothetical protein
LTADELGLIDAWFLGMGLAQSIALSADAPRPTPAIAGPQMAGAASQGRTPEGRDGRWWSSGGQEADNGPAATALDEFRRVVHTRLRG